MVDFQNLRSQRPRVHGSVLSFPKYCHLKEILIHKTTVYEKNGGVARKMMDFNFTCRLKMLMIKVFFCFVFNTFLTVSYSYEPT